MLVRVGITAASAAHSPQQQQAVAEASLLHSASQVSHTAIVPQYIATSLELVSALL
jgi:hypothetical protein